MDKSCRVYVGNLSWKVKWQDLKDHMKTAGDVTRADVFEDPTGRSKGCGVVEYSNPDDAQRAIKELTDTEIFERLIFVREDREEESGRGGKGFGGARDSGDRYPPRGGRRGGYNDSYSDRNNDRNDRYGDRNDTRTDMRFSDRNSDRYNERNNDRYNDRNSDRYNDRNNDRYNDDRYEPSGSRGGRGGGRGGRGGGYSRGGGDGSSEEIRGRQIFINNLPYRTSWQDLKDLMRSCGNVARADVLSHPDGKSKGVATVLFEDAAAAQRAVDEFDEYDMEGRKIGVKIDPYA